MSSIDESLQALEGLMNEFFAAPTDNERKREIESILNNFTQMSNAWEMCLYFMGHSHNEYVMMFCLNVQETMISHKWTGLAANDKMEIRTCLTQSLLNQHSSLPSYIRNKLAKLVVDIGRNDWPHFYPDFFSNILQLAQQPDTTLLGVILLQTASEELAAPRDDLSMARKDELHRLLLLQVPSILNILNNILESMLEKHRHLVAATPPPSPTSGEGRSSRQASSQLFSTSPIANANFVSLLLGSPNRGPQMEALPPLDPASQQLCYTTLTCLAHYLCWVPLSTVVRPQLLSTIFHFAAFGCQSRPDGNESSPSSRSTSFSSSTHKLGVLAMNCINEILSKNCVPLEFEDFLLQMFQQTFNLLQKITKESNTNSSGNRLEELDEVYVDKFTDFLGLFVSVHLRRFESNPQFPVLEFLSLLFKYTFRQPSTDGYFSCLDIWITFLDYLNNKLETRSVTKEDVSTRYKEALISLISSILQKFQFRYNQSQLEELDDDTLDDDEETEWQHYLRQNLEVVAKVAELLTPEVFQLVVSRLHFCIYLKKYSSFMCNSMEEITVEYEYLKRFKNSFITICMALENLETNCSPMKCTASLPSACRRDDRSLRVQCRRLQSFSAETHSLLLKLELSTNFSMPRLAQVASYGSRIKFFEVTTSAGVLQQDFIEVHAQSLAAIKAYTHWMSEFYVESLRVNQQKEEFNSLLLTVVHSITPLINKEVPDKVIQSAVHLLLSVTTTVRPAFLLHVAPVVQLYDMASQGHCQPLPQEIQMLLYRSLSHYLLLPWPNLSSADQDWDNRANHHKTFVSQLTSSFVALSQVPELASNKIAQEQAKEVIKKTLVICQDWVESLAGEVVKSKQICCISLQEVTQTTLSIFPIYVQDVDIVENIMTYFLAMFQGLRVQMGVAFTEKIIHTFMNVFSRELLAQTIHHETSGAFRVIENQNGFELFKTVDICKFVNYCLQFVFQAYGQSFLQTDISLFKQNLESLEALHFKWKLYNKKIFSEVMSHQFLKVLMQVLIQKSHDLLQEEIVISIYNMAAVDFDAFFTDFLPHFLASIEGIDNSQKAVLAKNFKIDRDLPSFTQSVQRFVNDIRYYCLVSSSLPAGSVSLV
uniref:Exportin-1/Importin-beta-like domain-containing protein n=1 Tax=Biomphalaria glabrata TaxID=6526 RepID=A0A2C9JQK7_BIOGL